MIGYARMAAVVSSGGQLPPFSWHQVAARWVFAPVVTALVAGVAAAYLWGVVRVRSRHPARPWPRWRTSLFFAGLGVVALATQSGIGAYDDALFWDHMIQHLLLIMVAPPLLVAGQPVTLLLHASRNPLHTSVKRAVRSRAVSWVSWPGLGIAAYAATIVGTHLTGAAAEVMKNEAAHTAEHALYVGVGYLFFLPLVGREPIRWRLSYPIRLAALTVIMPVDTFTGVTLGMANTGVAGPVSRPWGPTPVEDTHWAGAVMWIGGDAIMLALIMLIFMVWSRDDRAPAHLGWLESVRRTRLAVLGASPTASASGHDPAIVRVPGGAAAAGFPGGHRDVDNDDEQLAAYNAYLARLGRAEAASPEHGAPGG